MAWQGGVSLLLGFLYCVLFSFLFLLYILLSMYLVFPISLLIGFHAVWFGGNGLHWGRLVLYSCWATGFFLTGALLPWCVLSKTNFFVVFAYASLWAFPTAVVGGFIARAIRRWQEPPKRIGLPPLT
jgi:hypothetical protein